MQVREEVVVERQRQLDAKHPAPHPEGPAPRSARCASLLRMHESHAKQKQGRRAFALASHTRHPSSARDTSSSSGLDVRSTPSLLIHSLAHRQLVCRRLHVLDAEVICAPPSSALRFAHDGILVQRPVAFAAARRLVVISASLFFGNGCCAASTSPAHAAACARQACHRRLSRAAAARCCQQGRAGSRRRARLGGGAAARARRTGSAGTTQDADHDDTQEGVAHRRRACAVEHLRRGRGEQRAQQEGALAP